MFYATHDSDEFHINQNAHIEKFNTREDAESYLRSIYDPREWIVEVETGFFGDCWIKTMSAPKVGDDYLSPFSFTQITVRAPGQHPGGHGYWIEPRCDVLIARLRPTNGGAL